MTSAANDGSLLTTEYPILNPSTPMAYLLPDMARETAVASNIIVGTLAILTWDVLSNLSGDYRLLSERRIRLPTITYVLSRICSLAYVLWSAIFYTAPIGNCFQNEKGLGAFYPACVSLPALLFFFRVRIVYDGNTRVVGFFFCLWLAVVAASLTAAFGVTGVQIGPTQYCLKTKVEDYVTAAAVVPLVYDTLVFVAITYRLAASSHCLNSKHTAKRGVWAALSGQYLPGVSRALLKDGQSYYMVTVLSNLLAVITVHMSSLPATYRTIFSAPNVMLINIMACRVFRNTKFGAFAESTFGGSSTTLSTNIKNATVLPLAFRHHYDQDHDRDHDSVTGNEEGHHRSERVITLVRGDLKTPLAPTPRAADVKRTIERTISEEKESSTAYPPTVYSSASG